MDKVNKFSALNLLLPQENKENGQWEPMSRQNLYSILVDFDYPRLTILTKIEAYGILQSYEAGCFVIFQENKIYYLLAKINAEIQQFEILIKKHSLSFHLHFNLKNEQGHFLFNAEEISAPSLQSFLNKAELQEKFKFQLHLNDVQILGVDSLEKRILRDYLIPKLDILRLHKLTDDLQDKALFYFLNTFIYNLPENNIQFITDTLFNKQPCWKPMYRKHYLAEEIEENLNVLRALYQLGNKNAGLLLASLAYTGLIEQMTDNHLYLRVGLFPSPIPKEKFRDLEEYKNITQNQALFSDKTVRDLFLLKYFEAKADQEMINAQLKQIDVSKAIRLDNHFCTDYTILSWIKVNENSIQQLSNNQQIFHDLITLDRIQLANHIKDKIPEELLVIKDKENRNILHQLIGYLAIHGMLGSYYIMETFKFVSQSFPKLLAEKDNQDKTVYDRIEQLKTHCTERISTQIESILEQCQQATNKSSYRHS